MTTANPEKKELQRCKADLVGRVRATEADLAEFRDLVIEEEPLHLNITIK